MTNFRKLCEELLDELQYQTDWSIAEDLKERARAALVEPKSIEDRIAEADAAIEASIKRVRRIASMPAREFRARAALAEPEPEGPTDQPISVHERVPGPEDGDAWERNHPISDVWCWWWDSNKHAWVRHPISDVWWWNSNEEAWVRNEGDTYLTHWLPAHALPLPQ